MIAGAPPFSSQNKQKVYKNVMNRIFEMKPYFSENATDLINKLLTVNVTKKVGQRQNTRLKSA